MEKVQNKSKMALVYGEPGLGKTQSILWWAAKNDAAYIRASNSMTVKWFLEELVEELGETPCRLKSDLFKQAVNQLIIYPRVIIIDEIDYLLNESKTIETIRDIYDRTNTPIVLTGMSSARKKLARYRHIYDRIAEFLKFEQFSKKETENLLSELSTVKFSEDAIELIHKQSVKLRQLTSLIDTAEDIAKRNSLEIIDSSILKNAAEELISRKAQE